MRRRGFHSSVLFSIPESAIRRAMHTVEAINPMRCGLSNIVLLVLTVIGALKPRAGARGGAS